MAEKRKQVQRDEDEIARGPERHEPPRTTKGGVTSPKFGSAGSGGAELEQLPEQHDEEEKPTDS